MRLFRFLNAGIRFSVSGTNSTFDGRGRRAKSCSLAGCWRDGVLGVSIPEPTGVTARDERGLFFDLGLDGACRKSSGMSFQLSMAEGVGVVVGGTRGGAEVDFGGGGGRLDFGGITGGTLVGN